MSIGILACESLSEYVRAAQGKLGTTYPVYILDYGHDEDPEQMHSRIAEVMTGMPPQINTVLVAMGFCGGSWHQISSDRKIVIPRVDDCVSLLLNTDDRYCPNPKEMGHLYMTERKPEPNCKRLCQRCPRWKADACYPRWFANHSRLDIIDTGVFDCYSESYVRDAQKCADAVHCVLDFVTGSNLLMEKLIGGRWDEQFVVAEPGHEISHKDFF
ncbi:MAG: DUF1638 domain-containing protein [Faecousia sp.]